MPVRSLNSSVLKWPDRATVEKAAREWARNVGEQHQDILRIGFHGSYARGDWGVGSDLDIIVITTESPVPRERRGLNWSLESLPVPADLQVFTDEEWKALPDNRFRKTIRNDAVWIYNKTDKDSPE